MMFENAWTKVWTLHDAMGPGAGLIPKGAQFWIEPVRVNGELAYYCMCFEDGKMQGCFKGMKLYPLGVIRLGAPSGLPTWKENDTGTQTTFQAAALGVKSAGRKNPQALRLEGTFSVTADDNSIETETARLYFFTAAEADGQDWFVFDIIPSGMTIVQDGTGHGDH